MFIPVKKIQERGLLIKVRDVVAVWNHLLHLTGMSTDVAVTNIILSDKEGATNTGGNNKRTGGEQMKSSVQFVPRDFINPAPSSGTKRIVYPSA